MDLAHLAVMLSLVAPTAAGELAPQPGVYWDQTIEMQMGGMTAPPQTSRVCMPKKQDWSEPPAAQGDQECKVTDLKRSGQRMTWKMTCAGGMAGEGEVTWGADAYTGKTRMTTPMGEVVATMRGRKVGGDCDASEDARHAARARQDAEELDRQIAAAQRENARTMAATCAQAVDEMEPMALSTIPDCKDRRPAFCARLQTRAGFDRLAKQGAQARDEAAKLCRKDVAVVGAQLCSAAAKDHARGGAAARDAFPFIVAHCPDVARPIAQRECAGRSYTELDDSTRELCTTYARAELEEAGRARRTTTPAAADKPADAVQQGKKILKGLFGR